MSQKLTSGSCLEQEQQRPPYRRRRSKELPHPNMDWRSSQDPLLPADDEEIHLFERQANEYYVPLHPADLRMVLVGKTGSGKSAAGNTILGREGFESEVSPKSVTKECQIDEVISEEKTISVTDTPGVYDTEFDEKALRRVLERFIYMTAPGPHVFLLVISLGVRYSKEEKDAVQWICDHFGREALQYTVVLFTHTDELKNKTLEQYVNKSSELKKLIWDCGGRFHGLNNNNRNPHQVTQLLQKIEDMVESNRVSGREYYTNDMYETAQKQIEDARRLKKAEAARMEKKVKDDIYKKARVQVVLGVASGVGVGAAVSGGVVLGVTGLLALPGLLIGAGAITAVGGGVALFKNKTSYNWKCDEERKNK